jgi:hypothetical protein
MVEVDMAAASLHRTIERLGYRVTSAKEQKLEVKLPLFCSLHISSQANGHYAITPYFGYVRRTTATVMTQVIYAGFFLLALWAIRVDAELMWLLFIGIAAVMGGMVFDVYRYILTEVAMMRIHDRLFPTDTA